MANKSAKAAAPAPASEEAEFVIDVGVKVQFLGYGPDVPESERFIPEGTILTISAFGEDGAEDAGAIYATMPNPDFNSKKKEHPETNPALVETQVLDSEIGPVEEAAEVAEEVAEEVATPAAKEAPAPRKTAATKTAGKAVKTASKADTKADTKAVTTKTPTAKAKKTVEREIPTVTDTDELPDLETEDETVRALVEENAGNLVAIAQELEAKAATSEYHLGGVLYHVKKSGEYKEIEDGAYAGEGGWREFIESYFNVKYRKAQYLIEIYQAFSTKNIENAAEIVAGMGWSKAAKIANPLLNDYDADELIEAANTNTVEDLSTLVKEIKTEGGTRGTAGEKVTRLTMKFRLVQDDATTAETILKAAMEQQGTTDPGDALMTILVDWYNNNVAEGKAAEPEAEVAQQAPAGRKASRKATATA